MADDEQDQDAPEAGEQIEAFPLGAVDGAARRARGPAAGGALADRIAAKAAARLSVA